MLKRKMYDTLRLWRRNHQEECLLLKGARQVGKSFIVEAFGGAEYESFIELNFLKNPEFKGIFDTSLSADDIYRRMTLLIPDIRLIPDNTLIFLDEVQQCPQARTALKFLAQDGRYDVIASGSLLGLQYDEERDEGRNYSIPVGYERQLTMYPLDFEEYLWAKGFDAEALVSLRECFERREAVPTVVNDAMLSRLREYLAIGGMPAVVQAYYDSGSYGTAFDEQVKILSAYKDDIARYAKPTERIKARDCFLSLPRQLAKENTKFQYAAVAKGGSARKYGSSVDWLRDAEIVHYCRCVTTPLFPLAAYEAQDRFRVYASDTGLLMAMFGFEMMKSVIDNTLKGPVKGGLYENLVANMLVANGRGLHYWISKDAGREIEFLLDSAASVVPVEVKAGRGKSLSLDALLKDDDVRLGYKLIDGNVGQADKKVTLPLYMAMFLVS